MSVLSRALMACAALACAAPPGASAAPAESVELVQVRRVLPPDRPLKRIRDTTYATCAAEARRQGLPVQPFPPLPDVYEVRITTITNGASSIVKTESMFPASWKPILPSQGCLFAPLKMVTRLQITHAGKVTTMEDGGAPAVEIPFEPEDLPADIAAAKASTAAYTERRSVNGIALRCLPKKAGPLSPNPYAYLLALCVYDGVLLDHTGAPLVLLGESMTSAGEPDYAYRTITEPVSLRRIGAAEPDPYLPANWPKLVP